MSKSRSTGKGPSDGAPVTLGGMRNLLEELGLLTLASAIPELVKLVNAADKRIQKLEGVVTAQNEQLRSIAARTSDLEAFNAAPARTAQAPDTPEEFAREVARIMENDKSVMLAYPAGTTEDDKKAAEEMFQPAPVATTHITTAANGTQLRKLTFANVAQARSAASTEIKRHLRSKKVRVERVLTAKQNARKNSVGVPLAKLIRNSTRYSAHFDGVSMRVYIKDSYMAGKTIDISQFNASNLPKTLLDPRLQTLLHQAFPPSAPASPRSPLASSSDQHMEQQDDDLKRDRETTSPTPNKGPKRPKAKVA